MAEYSSRSLMRGSGKKREQLRRELNMQQRRRSASQGLELVSETLDKCLSPSDVLVAQVMSQSR